MAAGPAQARAWEWARSGGRFRTRAVRTWELVDVILPGPREDCEFRRSWAVLAQVKLGESFIQHFHLAGRLLNNPC